VPASNTPKGLEKTASDVANAFCDPIEAHRSLRRRLAARMMRQRVEADRFADHP
jgi:hypothetical protein